MQSLNVPTFLESLVTLAKKIKDEYDNDPDVFFQKIELTFGKIDKGQGNKHRNFEVKVKCIPGRLALKGTFAAPLMPENDHGWEHLDLCAWEDPLI
jgi:hypothetical protein